MTALELAHADASIATFFGVHAGLGMGSILTCGSQEQQQPWLLAMRRFEKRRVRVDRATGVILAGEPLLAAEAQQHGLVNELTAPGAAADKALDLTAQIARNARSARRRQGDPRVIAALDNNDAFMGQDEVTSGLASTEDAQEGAQAFDERRAPVWHIERAPDRLDDVLRHSLLRRHLDGSSP
jgi:hypothetical protein